MRALGGLRQQKRMLPLIALLCCVVVAAVPEVAIQGVSNGNELVVSVKPCGGITRVFRFPFAAVVEVRSEELEELVVEQDEEATRIVGAKPFLVIFSVSNFSRLWTEDKIWMDSPSCVGSGALVPRLECNIVVLRPATCHGSDDAQLTVESVQGVGALRVEWINAEAKKGGEIASVRVTDSVGRVCEDSIVIPPVKPLEGWIEVTHVRCFGGGDGTMNLTVIGGTPPYRFVWSGGGCADEDVSATSGEFSV